MMWNLRSAGWPPCRHKCGYCLRKCVGSCCPWICQTRPLPVAHVGAADDSLEGNVRDVDDQHVVPAFDNGAIAGYGGHLCAWPSVVEMACLASNAL